MHTIGTFGGGERMRQSTETREYLYWSRNVFLSFETHEYASRAIRVKETDYGGLGGIAKQQFWTV